MLMLLATLVVIAPQDTAVRVARGAAISIDVPHAHVMVCGTSGDRVTVRNARLAQRGNSVTIESRRDEDVIVSVPGWVNIAVQSIDRDITVADV